MRVQFDRVNSMKQFKPIEDFSEQRCGHVWLRAHKCPQCTNVHSVEENSALAFGAGRVMLPLALAFSLHCSLLTGATQSRFWS